MIIYFKLIFHTSTHSTSSIVTVRPIFICSPTLPLYLPLLSCFLPKRFRSVVTYNNTTSQSLINRLHSPLPFPTLHFTHTTSLSRCLTFAHFCTVLPSSTPPSLPNQSLKFFPQSRTRTSSALPHRHKVLLLPKTSPSFPSDPLHPTFPRSRPFFIFLLLSPPQ